MKRIYKLISLTILALVFLGLWLWLVDLGELVLFLGRVNLALLGPIFLVMVLRSLAASYRMKILMKPVGEGSIFYFWGLSFLGRITTLLVPFQGGAFLRAYLMKKKFHSSFSTCFAIVFFDLLLGVVILFLFSLLALPLFGQQDLVFWVVGIGLMAAAVLVLSRRKTKSSASARSFWGGVKRRLRNPDSGQARMTGRWVIGDRLTRAFSNFKLGLSLISKNRSLLPTALAVSLVIFLLTNLRMYLIFSAFGAEVSFMPIVFASALFGLSNLLPGTPIKIGQYELFGLLIYAYFLNLDKNLVAAAILFSHLLVISFSLLGGFTASVLLGVRFGGRGERGRLLNI